MRLGFPSRPFSRPKTQLGRNACRGGDPRTPGAERSLQPLVPSARLSWGRGWGWGTGQLAARSPANVSAAPGAGAQDKEQCSMLKPCDLRPPQAPTPSPGTGSWQGLGGWRGSVGAEPPRGGCVAGIRNSSSGRGRVWLQRGARLGGWCVPPTPRFKVVFVQTQHPSCRPLQVLFGGKKNLFKTAC